MEEALYGLYTPASQPKLFIKEIEGKGRGVIADEDIPEGKFVCEYATYLPPYPRSEKAAKEAEYSYNNEGSYILESQDKEGRWLCFDATRRYGTYGRYINHSRGKPNIKLHLPLLARGKLRVAFLSTCPIARGEELLYDYGVSPQGEAWLRKDEVRCRQSKIRSLIYGMYYCELTLQ